MSETFMGKRCLRKHSGERYSNTGRCVTCQGAPIELPTLRGVGDAFVRQPTRGRTSRIPRKRGRVVRTAAEARVHERNKRGMPTPTRPEPAHCECCGLETATKDMHLDHCHQTGAFRGWLCRKCNTGIGYLGDTSEGIDRAAAYLFRAHKAAGFLHKIRTVDTPRGEFAWSLPHVKVMLYR